MSTRARPLPPAFYPYFASRWDPWGKQRPVETFLKLVRDHRIGLNAVYDFSDRPVANRFGPEDHLKAFKGSLLEAWHRLHADRWEADLTSMERVRRPLRMHTAWFDWLRSMQAAGMDLGVRQHLADPEETQYGRPLWFDDCTLHPRLTRFWLDQGVDPAMPYGRFEWRVWLSVAEFLPSVVQALLEHGLDPCAPVLTPDMRGPFTALGSLGEAVGETLVAQPMFWQIPGEKAQRWHDVATLLVAHLPDLQAPANGERSHEQVLREQFPTVWADVERRALLNVDRTVMPIPAGPGRRRL